MADKYRRLVGKRVRAVVDITDLDDDYIYYPAGTEGVVVAPEIDHADHPIAVSFLAVSFLDHDDPISVARNEIALVAARERNGGAT